MSIEKDASKIGTNIQFKRKITPETGEGRVLLSAIDLAPGEPLLIPANKELRVGTTDGEKANGDNVLTLSPAKLVVTNSAANTSITDAQASNGYVYIKHVEDNGVVQSSHNIKGTNSVSVTSDASGNITIDGHYTLAESSGNIQLKDFVGEVSNISFATGANQGQIKVGSTDIDIKDLQTGSSPTFASAEIGGVTLDSTGYHGNAATASSVNIDNDDNTDNAVVSFKVGSGTPYSKTVNNVAHATTASKILIGDTEYTLSLNGNPSNGQITFITN